MSLQLDKILFENDHEFIHEYSGTNVHECSGYSGKNKLSESRIVF